MLRRLFQDGGAPLRALVLLAVLGLLAALLCGVGMLPDRRGRGTFWTGAYAILFGAATALFGAGAALTAAGQLGSLAREHKLHLPLQTPTPEAFRAARVRACVGLVSGAPPFLLGVAAVATGVRRRRQELLEPPPDDDDLETGSVAEDDFASEVWDDLGAVPQPASKPIPVRRRRGKTGAVAGPVVFAIGAAAVVATIGVAVSLRPPTTEESR